jgi:hypothetical protein
MRASSIELPPMSQTMPLRIGPAQKHALCRKPRLFVAVDDMQLEAGFAFDLAWNSGPSSASRTAAVATQVSGAILHAARQQAQSGAARPWRGAAFAG